MIMLPDNMFLNLIDMDLQQKIVMMDGLDGSAAKALKLKQYPHQWQKDWRIGKLKRRMDETFFSSMERTKYTKKYGLTMKSFHDHKTAGHLGKIGMYNAVQQHY